MPHPGPNNFNLAPTEQVPVLRLGEDGQPELVPMRWWLTPFWAKEPSTEYAMFNARSETAHKSPGFREPYRKRRCAVPVSGFYEWAKQTGGDKVPYFISSEDSRGLLIAGIWDRWQDKQQDRVIESFSVLTTAANAALEFVHKRQPVMLSLGDTHRWLDMAIPTKELAYLFESVVPIRLAITPVSSHVNNARNKDDGCLQATGEAQLIDSVVH